MSSWRLLGFQYVKITSALNKWQTLIKLFSFSYFSQNIKNSDTGNDKIVPKATASIPETEQLIAPGTPIQFDIVLPATEFLDQNRGSR